MAGPLTLLAFDYGTRRTGVAVGNTLLRRAQPLATLVAEGDAVFAKAEPLIRQWLPAALVVGIPLHPDGAAHENTHRAERFARRLGGRRADQFHIRHWGFSPLGERRPHC